MVKHLGIDYGIKRIGLALSDDSATLAFPKEVIENNNFVLDKIQKIIETENIKNIVIGESYDLHGKPNEIMTEIKKFKKTLEQFNLPINYEKEFLTSIEARRYHPRGKASGVDAGAAALILQRFLDKQKYVA